MKKYYAGIGARQTPPDVLSVMRDLGSKLENDGWILRSGGAKGADSAFEAGVKNPTSKEIFIPGRSFNGHYSNQLGVIDATQLASFDRALATVNQYHPAPDRLSPFARNLMARNAMQMQGIDMSTPSKLAVLWTPNAQPVGGTGQAMRMAGDLGIVVRNLADPLTYEKVLKYLNT